MESLWTYSWGSTCAMCLKIPQLKITEQRRKS